MLKKRIGLVTAAVVVSSMFWVIPAHANNKCQRPDTTNGERQCCQDKTENSSKAKKCIKRITNDGK